ncbi:hypothetical protein MUK42_36041, partial [Musa troglodytarum]
FDFVLKVLAHEALAYGDWCIHGRLIDWLIDHRKSCMSGYGGAKGGDREWATQNGLSWTIMVESEVSYIPSTRRKQKDVHEWSGIIEGSLCIEEGRGDVEVVVIKHHATRFVCYDFVTLHVCVALESVDKSEERVMGKRWFDHWNTRLIDGPVHVEERAIN